MAKVVVLVDIGSTFTKAAAVDLETPALIGRFKAPTTSEDVSQGLQNVLRGLGSVLVQRGLKRTTIANCKKLACSSAAGGLRMVAIGLVRDLTAKAAKSAALGAGARVLKTYSFQLTEADREEIIGLGPDIILLAGGTDGGNSANILHNAEVLATLPEAIPIVVAGNRSAAAEVVRRFPAGFSTYVAANVMPEIGKLDVEPAREVIRRVFMEKIIYAKGLSKAARLIDGIFMPTPAAVLRAGRLLSQGTPIGPGWGDLLIVDVGGATTDVHSLGAGFPSKTGVITRGLPEALAKRTVEGDLGVRVSVLSLLETVGAHRLARDLNLAEKEVQRRARQLHAEPQLLPFGKEEKLFDQVLGFHAVQIGVGRHVGRLSELYTPSGPVWIQEGKDLSQVRTVIGTGGVLINSGEPLAMLSGVQKKADAPLELRPENPRYFLDKDYLLAPGGLLAAEYPEVACQVLTDSLKEYELAGREK